MTPGEERMGRVWREAAARQTLLCLAGGGAMKHFKQRMAYSDTSLRKKVLFLQYIIWSKPRDRGLVTVKGLADLKRYGGKEGCRNKEARDYV